MAVTAMVMLDGEPLSPELVLVSPELAERARALLPDRPDFLSKRDVTAASTSTGSERLDLPSLELQPDDRGAPQQRLDELTTLVDRIATDWQHVERRLVQVERAVARMEKTVVVATTPPAPWLEVQPAGDEERRVAPAAPQREARTRTGLAGTLVVIASVIAAMVAVELLPSAGDRPRLAVVSEGAVPTEEAPAAQPSGTPAATTTSDGEAPPGSTTTATDAPPTRPSEPAAPPRSTETSRSATTARPEESRPPSAPANGTATTTRTAPSPRPAKPPTTTGASSFEPARVFLWPATAGAAGYDVTFLRNGQPFYSAQVAKPRLELPEKIRFRPGSYRWIVRPRAAGQPLGSPIVNSTFTIEQS